MSSLFPALPARRHILRPQKREMAKCSEHFQRTCTENRHSQSAKWLGANAMSRRGCRQSPQRERNLKIGMKLFPLVCVHHCEEMNIISKRRLHSGVTTSGIADSSDNSNPQAQWLR